MPTEADEVRPQGLFGGQVRTVTGHNWPIGIVGLKAADWICSKIIS